MVSVMAYLEPGEGGAREPMGCKAEVDTIEMGLDALREGLTRSMRLLRRSWNDIIQNDMRMDETRTFLQTCSEFRELSDEFDNCICRNDEAASEILNDWWIGRSYFVTMHKWREDNGYMADYVQEKFVPLILHRDPFRGIGRKFKKYFAGVREKDFEAFVRYGTALPSRPVWLGERCEAVIMGQIFERSCSEMNKAFLILGRDRMPRNLSYQNDAPRMDENYYEINHLCLELKSALKKETSRH